MVFQDSDVAKWLEAVAWSLCQKPDAELEKTADEVIALVAAAQCEDGYLNTYFTVKAPAERWTNLAECHELYCAGHMIEAGVAYFQGTGKRRLLDVVCRLADHIDSVFGPGENQLHGYPGHPEIELALMRLYDVTQEQRYLNLVKYFIEERGAQPHFYDIEYEKRGRTSYWNTYGPAWMVKDKAYSQAHLPLAEQQTAIGHAVRFVYLMAGMAHLARLSCDEGKRQDCLRLWNNMAQRQLLHHRRDWLPKQRRGVQQRLRSAQRYGLRRKLRLHRPDDVCPPDAGDGGGRPLRRRDGARAVQHGAGRHGAGW